MLKPLILLLCLILTSCQPMTLAIAGEVEALDDAGRVTGRYRFKVAAVGGGELPGLGFGQQAHKQAAEVLWQ